MKKKTKGFTLVECITAMAILGITALTIAQVYGAVARLNVRNTNMNISLAKQMEHIERATGGAETISFNAGDVQFRQLATPTPAAGLFGGAQFASYGGSQTINANVRMNVLQTIDINDVIITQINNDSVSAGFRYKYFNKP